MLFGVFVCSYLLRIEDTRVAPVARRFLSKRQYRGEFILLLRRVWVRAVGHPDYNVRSFYIESFTRWVGNIRDDSGIYLLIVFGTRR